MTTGAVVDGRGFTIVPNGEKSKECAYGGSFSNHAKVKTSASPVVATCIDAGGGWRCDRKYVQQLEAVAARADWKMVLVLMYVSVHCRGRLSRRAFSLAQSCSSEAERVHGQDYARHCLYQMDSRATQPACVVQVLCEGAG